MHDILCIYFSRSGNTRAAAEQIAAALDAELAEITDAQDPQRPEGLFPLGARRHAPHGSANRPASNGAPAHGLPPCDPRLARLGGPLRQPRACAAQGARRRAAARRLCPHARREPQIRGDLRSDRTAISPRSTNWPSPCGQGARAMTSGWAISYRTSSACLRSDDDAGKAAEN